MLTAELNRVKLPGRSAPALAALVAFAFFAARTAQAQTPPASEDEAAPLAEPEPGPSTINLTGRPTMDLSTAPPPPLVGRTYQVHQGFYVRANAGIGAFVGGKSQTGALKLDTGGLSLDYDILIGGGPAPGFTLGGAVVGSFQLSGEWETDGGAKAGSGNLSTFIIGPFADGFPDSKGGWHLGGMAGLARAGYEAPVIEPEAGDSHSTLGFGGAFWVGHDVWVAPEWSVGGLLRVQASHTTNSDDDVTINQGAVSLMFTVLYN
jgi:hypothetical protein